MVKNKQQGQAAKNLPSNPQAEASVLGGCIVDGNIIPKVRALVAPEDFFLESNRIVYRAILSLADEGKPVDQITLADRLAARHELDRMGGRPRIVELANNILSATSWLTHAKIVARLSMQRKLIKAALDISALAYDDQDDESALVLESFRILARCAVEQRRLHGCEDAEAARLFSMGLELMGMAASR